MVEFAQPLEHERARLPDAHAKQPSDSAEAQRSDYEGPPLFELVEPVRQADAHWGLRDGRGYDGMQPMRDE